MLRTEQTETIENFVCLPACSVRKSFTAIFATEHEPLANHPWPVRGGGNRESSCFRESLSASCPPAESSERGDGPCARRSNARADSPGRGSPRRSTRDAWLAEARGRRSRREPCGRAPRARMCPSARPTHSAASARPHARGPSPSAARESVRRSAAAVQRERSRMKIRARGCPTIARAPRPIDRC